MISRLLRHLELIGPDETAGSSGRRVLTYFGLRAGDEASRYSSHPTVSKELDDDIDSLRARIAELERRLDEQR